MKIILSLFRWILGLLFGLFLFVLVLVTIPLSVAGKQLFEKESGMAWLTTFTEDKTVVEKFIDSIFEGIASSSSIEDPLLKQASKMAADKNSPFGASVRKVFNPVSVSGNLLVNANSFYNWLDGTSAKFPVVYKIGGTTSEQVSLVSAFLKLRYDQLPACTVNERKSIGKVDANSILELSCSVGSISTGTFDSAAKNMMSEPEAKDILAKGINADSGFTEKNRTEILALKKIFASGVGATWVLIVVSSLFMILLFTPYGVNFIATGVTVGMAGLTLGGMGQVISSFGEIMKTTLGQKVTVQGVFVAFFGLFLVCIGIWQIIQKKAPSEVVKNAEPMKKEEPVIVKKEEKK